MHVFTGCYSAMCKFSLFSVFRLQLQTSVGWKQNIHDLFQVWHTNESRNRSFAAKPSCDLLFIKLWAATLRMSEMEKAFEKKQNGQIWSIWHKKMRFYDGLNFKKIKKICMEKVAGEQDHYFHINLLIFFEIQTIIKSHSLMLGTSNFGILVFSICSFHFWQSLSYSP